MMCNKHWLPRGEPDGRAAWKSWSGKSAPAPLQALFSTPDCKQLSSLLGAGRCICCVESSGVNKTSHLQSIPSKVKCFWGSEQVMWMGEAGWVSKVHAPPERTSCCSAPAIAAPWELEPSIRKSTFLVDQMSGFLIQLNSGNQLIHKNKLWAKQK